MKLFFGTKKPARPVDVINQSVKAGIGIQRYKISREHVEELRRLEHEQPEQALPYLLRVLRVRK